MDDIIIPERKMKGKEFKEYRDYFIKQQNKIIKDTTLSQLEKLFELEKLITGELKWIKKLWQIQNYRMVK